MIYCFLQIRTVSLLVKKATNVGPIYYSFRNFMNFQNSFTVVGLLSKKFAKCGKRCIKNVSTVQPLRLSNIVERVLVRAVYTLRPSVYLVRRLFIATAAHEVRRTFFLSRRSWRHAWRGRHSEVQKAAEDLLLYNSAFRSNVQWLLDCAFLLLSDSCDASMS